jgi:hypothetical protein
MKANKNKAFKQITVFYRPTRSDEIRLEFRDHSVTKIGM